MAFDLAPTIGDAVRLYGGGAAGVFTSEAFGRAVAIRFDLRRAPDNAWCARVLSAERRVVRFKGHDFWKLAPEGSRCP